MSDETISFYELRQLRLQAVLAEYQALRTEILQKFRHHLLIYSVTVAFVTAILGWVITKGAYDALLLIPIFSTALSLRYIWEQNVIAIIGDYLKRMEKKIFPLLLSGDTVNDNSKNRLINWEHYFRANFPKLPLYKPAIQIVLVIIPLLPAVVFSTFCLMTCVSYMPAPIKSHLHPAIHLVALVIYVPMGIYIAVKLWKA
ncbi:MAG: hypothetical protein ACFFBU_10230 [Promethearchaeota archaeon]